MFANNIPQIPSRILVVANHFSICTRKTNVWSYCCHITFPVKFMDVHVLSKVLNLASHRVHQNVVQNVKQNYQRCTFGLPSLYFPSLFFFPSPVLEIYLKHATMHSTNPLRHFYSFCCYFCILVLQLPCNDTFPFLREFSFLFAPQLMLVIPSLRKKLQVVLAL